LVAVLVRHGFAATRGSIRRPTAAINSSVSSCGSPFWAFAYNLAALPLTVGGLLNPLVAGAAMVLSSIFVVSNSLRLRRFKAERLGIPPTGMVESQSAT